ncbi:hypothetical protein G4Y79_04055 [Phototrophicus methaneseepsis]|uniref:Uncharacterized protein n=1 Tax=Phototrophicus methaneseepsis TaxID=2710758 RepID=A0A7S8EAY4_9CHLR|nr:hypothetical protein [Phototrophicus methaneseepsis]QPC83567.1 hypothetical protein G4Y79_04055 [Phototrophicus methaneseepsis]
MDKRDQFLADVAGDDHHAALLVAQVGAMPTEIQLIVDVARYDESVDGLRPLRSYIIRVVGAIEHGISDLGTTSDDVRLLTRHPLLYQYTDEAAALFFRGRPDDANALALDIAQAHASTFGPWRHFPEYINPAQSLLTLLTSGGGLLGQMPKSLADALVPVLTHHGLETKVMLDVPQVAKAEGPLRDQDLQVLLIGHSYFVSYAFSFDEVGKV